MSLKLYGTLADWYTLLTPPADYREEAVFYTALIRQHARRDVRSVLELGCGSGANASHMKQWFDEMVLMDLSEDMLRQCRQLNPDLEQRAGDMRTFRCNRRFDAVFVHDAVSYITTQKDLAAVVETAAVHLQPGGVALFCPDDTYENYSAGTDDGGSDGSDGRGVRYLAWSIPGPDENTVLTDYMYMLRDPDGSVRVEYDRHVTGRLSEATWTETLRSAGFEVRITALEHAEVEPGEHHTFVAIKPTNG